MHRGWLAAALLWASLSAHGQTPPSAVPAVVEVLRVGDDSVSWPEFRYWLLQAARHYRERMGLERIDSWDVKVDGASLREYLLGQAAELARQQRAIEREARIRGIALDAADLAEIAQEREDGIRSFGGLDMYRVVLASQYGTEEVLDRMRRVDRLGQRLFAALWGPAGERCSDQDVSDFMESQGLSRAQVPTDFDAKVIGGRSLRYWAAYRGAFRRQVVEWSQALPLLPAAAMAKIDPVRVLAR